MYFRKGLDKIFKELRETTYDLAAGKGAWFHAAIKVDPNGKFNIQYEYEKKPNFTYEPDSSKYVDDLKRFPREESLVPQWLKELVNS